MECDRTNPHKLLSPYFCWIFKFNFYFLLESLSTEYVDHFYFVHSSVAGHFQCFQVLAMVNIVGVQDCQPVTFGFSFSQVIGPAVGVID